MFSDEIGFGASGMEMLKDSCTGLFEIRCCSSIGSSFRSSVCIEEVPLESLLEDISWCCNRASHSPRFIS